jgi:hypothetical protein
LASAAASLNGPNGSHGRSGNLHFSHGPVQPRCSHPIQML